MAMIESSGVQLALRGTSWFQRNGWTLAKIGIPLIGGIAAGMGISELVRPTSSYNSGGAPIVVQAPASQGSDLTSSFMNMMPTMMMMMMMLPMMQNMGKTAAAKADA